MEATARTIGILIAALGLVAASQAGALAQDTDGGAEAVALISEILVGDIEPVPKIPFGEPTNPVGVEFEVAQSAPRPDWARSFVLGAGGLNFSIAPDGSLQSGDQFTYGAPDDPFAVQGQTSFTVIDFDGLLDPAGDHFVDIALLVSLPGLPQATALPGLASDPSAGFNARVSVNNENREWQVSFEQSTGTQWEPFQSPVDVLVSADLSASSVMFANPPRFWSGATAIQAQVVSFPFGATDPSEAFLVTADMSIDPVALDAFVATLVDEDLDAARAVLESGAEALPLGTGAALPIGEDSTDGTGGGETDIADDSVGDLASPTAPVGDVANPAVVESNPAPEPDASDTTDAESASTKTGEQDNVEQSDSGGLNPVIPIGVGVLGALTAGGVVIWRRRRPSPYPLQDNELVETPLDPEAGPDHRRGEVMPPLSHEESDAETRRLVLSLLNQLLNRSLDEGAQPDADGNVKISPSAFGEVMGIWAVDKALWRDDVCTYSRHLKANGKRFTVDDGYGYWDYWDPSETSTCLMVHKDTFMWEIRPIEENEASPIEENDATLASGTDTTGFN